MKKKELLSIFIAIHLGVVVICHSAKADEFSTNPGGNSGPSDQFSTNTGGNPTNSPSGPNGPGLGWDYYAPKKQKQLTWPEQQAIYAGLPTDACGLTQRMSQLLNEHLNDRSYPDQRSMSVFLSTGNEIVHRMQTLPISSNTQAGQCISAWMGLYQAMTRVVANNAGVDRGRLTQAVNAATAHCIVCGGNPDSWQPPNSSSSFPKVYIKIPPQAFNPVSPILTFLIDWLENTPPGIAHSNSDVLRQFLTGKGSDYQPHDDYKQDKFLRAFVNSPAGEIVRKQYEQNGYPAKTDKLHFGTIDAFFQTIAPTAHTIPGTGAVTGTMAGVDVPPLVEFHNPLDPSVQVGGFGNPPQDLTWAKATGTRVNAKGVPDSNGKYVEYNIVNLAGRNSFLLHVPSDRPFGSTGPMRTIVQTFSWTESLPKADMMGRYEYQAPQ